MQTISNKTISRVYIIFYYILYMYIYIYIYIYIYVVNSIFWAYLYIIPTVSLSGTERLPIRLEDFPENFLEFSVSRLD